MFKWAFKKIIKLREKVAVDLGGGDVEKPFLEHLDDLRSMIVRMCVTLIVVTLTTFIYCEELLQLIEYPLSLAGIQDKITLQNLRVTGGFMTAMNVSLVAGVVLAFPLLLYFLLQFVLPGLKNTEKKVVFPALAVGGGLFLIGVLFAFLVVTPRALQFFYQFSVDVGSAPSKTAAAAGVTQQPVLANGFGILWESTNPQVKNTIEASVDGKTWSALTAAGPDGKPVEPKDIRYVRIASAPVAAAAATDGKEKDAAAAPVAATVTTIMAARPFIWELTDYVKFVCQFVLIFGACFELPVVVMALVKLDVLNYKVMKGSRAWAVIIIAVVAAFITPTQDALTLGLLALPMYALYEICIWLAWWMEKKDRVQYPEYYKDRDEDEKALEVADDWDNENYNPFGQEQSDEDEESESSKPAAKPAAPATPETATTPAAEGATSGEAASPAEPDHAGEGSSEPETTTAESGTPEPPPAGEAGETTSSDAEPGTEGTPSGDEKDKDGGSEGEKRNTD